MSHVSACCLGLQIKWIIRRAKRREHPSPNTFMSSKPDTGINHKVYGMFQ